MAIEVAQAYVAIIPSMRGIQGEIADALGADKVGSDAGKTIGSGIHDGISAKAVAIGNVITDAIRGAVRGAVDLGKGLASGVYDGFAANEQLVGGVEKIFDQANISGILADAQGAYYSLNMSANDYLESINKVGATFAQTMGDQAGYDTAKAGMQAIADFASGTGADLDLLNDKYQLITRAASSYQSVADQFAGILPQTNKDFLEQAAAAGYLKEGYESLTDVPIAEYQQAVTKMIERGVGDMGLLGNTVGESTKTITGSASMARAAWSNVLTSIGTGDTSQIERATRGLMDSVFGVINDETGRREGGLVANLSALAGRSFAALGQALPGMVTAALDAMPPDVGEPLRKVFDGIADTARTLAPVVIPAISGIVTAIGAIAPVVAPLIPLIAGAMGAVKVVGVISSIVGAIGAFITTAGAAISMISGLPALIGATVTLLGGPVTVIAAIVGAIVAFIATNEDARAAIAATWDAIRAKVTGTLDVIKTVVIPGAAYIVSGIVQKFSTLVGTVSNIFNNVKNAILNPLNAARSAVSSAISRIKSIINGAHLSLPRFKLPHFRIYGGTLPWGIGGKGSPPSINVDWYARGGWVDDATLIGAGERGGELIWPGYAPYLDRYAQAIAANMPEGAGGSEVNVYIGDLRVNDDDAIRRDALQLVTDLLRVGDMNRG